MRWHGYVSRKALELEVETRTKERKPKWTPKKQVWEESQKIDLCRENVPCRSKWIFDVNVIAAKMNPAIIICSPPD